MDILNLMTRTMLAVLLLLSAIAAAPPTRAEKDTAKSAHQPNDGQQSNREWEILFADGITVEEYARQMDYFKIEVGAVSKSGKIEYISKISQPKPEKRTGQVTTEYRPHIGWKKGQLHAADRRLLAKAGIASADKELWHFFEPQTQTRLAELECSYANRAAGEIKRTRFEIRAAAKGKGYEFVVIEQDPPRRLSDSTAASSANQPDSTPR